MPAFTNLLLGPKGHQRVRTAQALLALAVYVVFCGVQQVEVMLEFIDQRASNWLSAFNLLGASLFYLLIRSGINLRLVKDPALTFPQMLFAMVSIAGAYAISGPVRGAVISIMMLVIMFGMFALPAAQSRALAVIGYLLLAGVMAYKGFFDPGSYDPRVDLMHLAFAVVVLVAVLQLAIRLGRLRERLRAQKVELVQALERIRDLATRDPLTGLLNRRAMNEALYIQAGDRRNRAGTMSLALIDLDHFKKINDNHGHAVGDRVLKLFAERAQEGLRAGDVLARWGGEEFLLVLPGTGVEAAMACVERIRTRLLAHPFGEELDQAFAITFSCGITACGDAEDIESAVERADQAMYRAKTSGRNRSCSADAPQLVAQDLTVPRIAAAA